MNDYRCWTCDRGVQSQDIERCTRPYCQAKKELAKDKLINKRKADDDKPDGYDHWTAA